MKSDSKETYDKESFDAGYSRGGEVEREKLNKQLNYLGDFVSRALDEPDPKDARIAEMAEDHEEGCRERDALRTTLEAVTKERDELRERVKELEEYKAMYEGLCK